MSKRLVYSIFNNSLYTFSQHKSHYNTIYFLICITVVKVSADD